MAGAAAAANSFACAIINSPTESDVNTQSQQKRCERTNETEETHDTPEHLHNEDLDEEVRVCRVRERSSRARDAHGDTAEQVACAYSQAAPEERETCPSPLLKTYPAHRGNNDAPVK